MARRFASRASHPTNRARVTLDRLEQRELPAVFVVTSTADAVTPPAGSLRQALINAANNPGPDTITFDAAVFNVARTISLAAELPVNSDVVVQGPGSALLTINGNNATRGFNVSGPGVLNVTISGLTITNCKISAADGGGIFNDNENLTVLDAKIINNTSTNDGGGIAIGAGGSLVIRNSTISNNFAAQDGGGIYFFSGGSLLMENTTVSGNTANLFEGGGIYFAGPIGSGGFTIRNSTIANNSSGFSGGGIAFSNVTGGTPVITNSTITGNTAKSTTAGYGGGGIGRKTGSNAITLVSTIVSNNNHPTAPDILAGVVTATHSAIGSAAGIGSLTNINTLIGADLKLQPLADNGGPTQTIALGAGSAAINAGLNPPGGGPFDQRGSGFVRSAGTTDIGAFEVQPPAGVPTAFGVFPNVTTAGATLYSFTMTYADDSAIDVGSIDDFDVRVTGPNGVNQLAQLVGFTPAGNGSPRTATYKIAAPGGIWDVSDNGTYTVSVEPNQIADIHGNFVPSGSSGQFLVSAPGATFVVTNDNDGGPGSLRQAVLNANANAGPDVIVFDNALFGATDRVITLTGGEITITDSVTILGPGKSLATVDGNKTGRIFTVNGSGTITVTINGLTLTRGQVAGPGGAIHATDDTLTVINSTLTDNRSSSGGGGAIAGTGSITVRHSAVTNNVTAGAGVDGGGVRVIGGSLTIESSTLSGNVSADDGGAVYLSNAGFALIGSTLANNQATGLTGEGGGVFFAGSVGGGGLTVRNSTIAQNSAGSHGGGVHLQSLAGNLVVTNSTVVGNQAGLEVTTGIKGGGISQTGGSGIIEIESTVVGGNTAPANADVATVTQLKATRSAIGSTAGVTIDDRGGNLMNVSLAQLQLGALADNGGPTQTMKPAATSPLVDAGSNPAGLATDQRGQARVSGLFADIGAVEIESPGNPIATGGPFANVTTAGGTQYLIAVTYLDETGIQVGSLGSGDVIVTGPNGFTAQPAFVGVDLAFDGSPRVATYKLTPPGGSWDGGDSGVYTISVPAGAVTDVTGLGNAARTLGSFVVDLPATFIVTNTNDTGPGSLRQAVFNANATASPDTITFDPAVFGTVQTIKLTTGELVITQPVLIDGPGAGWLTVHGNTAGRIFKVLAASNGPTIAVELGGVRVTGGKVGVEGGAIFQQGPSLLTVRDAVLTGNAALGSGGAIFLQNSTSSLAVIDSVISDNSVTGAGNDGGAINAAGSSSISITRSTLSGNTAAQDGGAIYFNFGGSLLVQDSTLSNNKASSRDGGAIYFFGPIGAGGFTIRNSTLSGNIAGRNGGGVAFDNVTGTPVIQNATIVNNKAGDGGVGGGGLARVTGGNAITLASSIVAGNTAYGTVASDVKAGVVNSDRNAFGTTDGIATFNDAGNKSLVGAALNLGPLQFNGGPTQTHALLTGSPAINAGFNPAALTADQRGLARSVGATDVGAFEVQAPPTAALTVNDGASQRSMVTGLTVTFGGIVNLGGTAFTLARTGPGGPTGTVSLVVQVIGNSETQTTAKLTFNPGPLVEANTGSLIDGNYSLTLAAGQIIDPSGQQLDGNGDGTGGDNKVFGVRRLFGDSDGNGNVNFADFLAFRGTFGLSSGQAGYLGHLDADGNGSVNFSDFLAFRTRFGTSI